MRGDKVIVRAYGDEPKIVRVWDVLQNTVLVCSEENYHTLVNGKDGLWPVGFPKEYVFRYNPKINLTNPVNWEQLNTYG